MTTATQTKTDLWPIVNGSFNHELTNEEMLSFDLETKKQMTWNLIVSLEFAHSFRDIDPRVFVADPPKYTHDILTADRVDDIMITVRTIFQQKHKDLLRLTGDYYYRLGKRIAEAQKELGFSGFIQMDFRKLIGYIHSTGSWNEFSHIEVADAVSKIDSLAPRFYVRNNCNNGKKYHKWTTTGEYITMRVDYAPIERQADFLSFYKMHFEPIAKSVKADSVRYELTEIDQQAFAIEFVMWWD